MLLIQCSIKNSLVNVWLGKIPQPMKITVVTTILTRIFQMTNLTKFQLLGPPKPLILNRNEWVLSDLGNGDSNRLKARCTFLVATKIANNCLLHPRSLASIWRDPSLQLSLLTVSCRYGASRARGLSWPQQSCYNTFTTLANFQQQKSKELDHQSSGHNAQTK